MIAFGCRRGEPSFQPACRKSVEIHKGLSGRFSKFRIPEVPAIAKRDLSVADVSHWVGCQRFLWNDASHRFSDAAHIELAPFLARRPCKR